MSETFEKIIKLNPAFDKRHKDPSKNYGIHGVELLMVLKGKKGAVQFLLYTGWHLPHVVADIGPGNPFPADLGYHSPKPMYDGQSSITDSCEYLNGVPCFYDGSSLAAEQIYNVLLEKGSDGVWEELQKYYDDVFKDKK